MKTTVTTPIGEITLAATIDTAERSAALGPEFDWCTNPVETIAAISDARKLTRLIPALVVSTSDPATLTDWLRNGMTPEERWALADTVTELLTSFFRPDLQDYIRSLLETERSELAAKRQRILTSLREASPGGTGSGSPAESSDSPTPASSTPPDSTACGTDANDTTTASPHTPPPASSTPSPSATTPSTPTPSTRP